MHVMRGQEYIGPSVKAALDSMGMNASGQQRDVMLSKRELEVVRLFRVGHDDYGNCRAIAPQYQNNQHAEKYGDAQTRHRTRFRIVSIRAK